MRDVVPRIMNAYSARRAFTQVGNLSASVRPLLRIERAVIDRADRVGQRLRGDPIQAGHVDISPLNCSIGKSAPREPALEPVAVVLSVSGALLRRFILRVCREKCRMARLGRCRANPALLAKIETEGVRNGKRPPTGCSAAWALMVGCRAPLAAGKDVKETIIILLFRFKCKLTLRQRLRRRVNELISSVNFHSECAWGARPCSRGLRMCDQDARSEIRGDLASGCRCSGLHRPQMRLLYPGYLPFNCAALPC